MTKTSLQFLVSLSILLSVSLLIVVATPARALEISPDEVRGRYWLPDHDGQVEIYAKGRRYFGRVVAYDVAGQLDEENADRTLRGRPFLGIEMFGNFRFDSDDGRWVDGTIYDGGNGKTYECTMWFEAGEPNVLVARGFIGFSLLGRNTKFDRVVPQ